MISVSDSLKKYGRKPKLTPEKLLEAIREYASTEPSLLGERLGVNRTTVWRCMQKIPEEQIEETLREVAELELKPAEYNYDVFLQIPEMREYKDKLVKKSPKYRQKMLRGIFRICMHLKKHPAKLTVKDAVELLNETELGKAPFPKKGLKKFIRSWFRRRGISGAKLTSEGIESPKIEIDPERAKARLSPQQRKRFMETLKEEIKDMEEPLKVTWLTIPLFFYYTGTRLNAMLKTRIENSDIKRQIGYVWVIDKGNIKWCKRITGELKDLVVRMLELRGNPEEGYLFDLGDFAIRTKEKIVREMFTKVYEKAGIPKSLWDGMPCHIWRHTADQDLLEATNYNYDLAGEILGWVSTDTQRKVYGKMGDKILDMALTQAMGIKVEWEKREFKF